MKDTSVGPSDLPLDLASARERYLAEQEKDTPNPSVKFVYAKALTCDEKRENKIRGIGLLKDMLDEARINKVECLYYLASTYFDMGDSSNSRKYCELLLRLDPTHKKAIELHRYIRENMKKDGAIGLGLAAGAVVIVGIALKFLLHKK
ncbi:unnamed protein product [Aphanomyces euteiches]|uniref:Mitochondrial fission 1 protein n=1 Tax=Aphanomyces euteiches TaxID=100861 RepID=A0A6G0WGJ7_9STRA|nr:hypothetical protein Ae201684_015471 [Aphanomyces euteiches]KAG9415483.1 hypothetical protein AC1031_008927 [Aphanomyces cochlioides]KAH9097621.1 hypothetical protein Ae201684P_001097 [Aphanomyces euteiches]KAH9115908.1 hypothetical protein AeMF1_010092 [Aphanomyces euteiches]KAH9147987.1 hypothetical protein AeRB84_008499 [Aphanomyces euteiches]